MAEGWVYLVTNRPNGTLYVGVTDNLARRIWEHREGLVEGFTKRYGLKRLVYAEHYEEIRIARQREQNLKHYPRAWKVRLILSITELGGSLQPAWVISWMAGPVPGHEREWAEAVGSKPGCCCA
jgi:putative endonuclease